MGKGSLGQEIPFVGSVGEFPRSRQQNVQNGPEGIYSQSVGGVLSVGVPLGREVFGSTRHFGVEVAFLRGAAEVDDFNLESSGIDENVFVLEVAVAQAGPVEVSHFRMNQLYGRDGIANSVKNTYVIISCKHSNVWSPIF